MVKATKPLRSPRCCENPAHLVLLAGESRIVHAPERYTIHNIVRVTIYFYIYGAFYTFEYTRYIIVLTRYINAVKRIYKYVRTYLRVAFRQSLFESNTRRVCSNTAEVLRVAKAVVPYGYARYTHCYPGARKSTKIK